MESEMHKASPMNGVWGKLQGGNDLGEVIENDR
jgi:hypothetical protein